MPLLVVEPAPLAGTRRLGRLAWNRRTGGVAHQRHQSRQRLLAIALLAALALGRQHQHAVAGEAAAGQTLEAMAYVGWQRGRMPHVEAQLHSRRGLVDVLAAGAGGAHEALPDLRRIERDRCGDPDRRGTTRRKVAHERPSLTGGNSSVAAHSRPPALRSMASIEARLAWRA